MSLDHFLEILEAELRMPSRPEMTSVNIVRAIKKYRDAEERAVAEDDVLLNEVRNLDHW